MSFLHKFLFKDATVLVQKAKKIHLEADDVLDLPNKLNPKTNYFPEEKLDYSSEKKLLLSSLIISSKEMKPSLFWYLMSTISSLLTPVLIHRFISLIQSGVDQSNLTTVIFYGVMLGVSGFLTGFLLQHYFYHQLQAYQVVTNILNKKIYSHSLRLTMSARQKNQLGDIVNYMSTDADAIADFGFVFSDLLINLLTMIGVVGMLFYYLGTTAIISLVCLSFLFPLTKFIAKKFTVLDEEMMEHRDSRVTLMGQVLNAIRIVKYFAWEKSIENEVLIIREKELKSRKKLARQEVLSGLAYMLVSTFVLFITLYFYSYKGNQLTVALIFTSVSLFGLLEGPFGDLSHLISRFINGYIGSRRIIKYLKEDSLGEWTKVNGDQSNIANSVPGVKLENFSATYKGLETYLIKNLNFELKPGESLAIVGKVGSGKTTLINSLMSECDKTLGKIQWINDLHLRKAYLPQEAFIVNTTLKENLLFGNSASQSEIDRAIYLSILQKDLSTFTSGLDTEIGEKGVNLSGGQKQRVGLARAVIQKPTLVFLDDPLSAVDGSTENALIERLIFGEWKNITRIIATHRLFHLDKFDKILFLDQGEQKAFGKLDELLKDSMEFKEFYSSEFDKHSEADIEISEVHVSKTNADQKRITNDEDRELGAVKGKVYWDYLSSLGGESKYKNLILLALFFSAIAVSLAPLAQKYWLSYFSTNTMITPLNGVLIYGLIAVFTIFLNLLNNFFWLERGVMAGKNMHNKMLKSVLAAPVRFFDSTPVGRILQRFSRDVESVDVYLQWSFVSVVHSLLQILVSLFLILTLMPLMILVIIPVMFIYYQVQNNYRIPAREVKRLDSIARSPRYAHFKETLQGLNVIRGFNKEDWFLETFFEKLTKSQKMFYSHYLLNRWFSSRIPLVGGVIAIFTTLGVSVSSYYKLLTPGEAALVTTYSLTFWSYLNWGIRQFSDIESRMTSVERLNFFSNLQSEDYVGKNIEVKKTNWPNSGEIEVKDLTVRYAKNLPTVLKNISFKIKSGERVGIIGRTGSGKTTLFQALYRFVDIESGEILIDGVNINNLSLHTLRRNLAIIPQDPILFMGTIRSNLDRFNEYSDENIKEVLIQTDLWNFVCTLENGINTYVNEGGMNFSQGQRQLFCLARALLLKSKIVVMDEATASVDIQTDAMLQKIIRQELKGVTMLIIAHRLSTVADADQILELKDGELISQT